MARHEDFHHIARQASKSNVSTVLISGMSVPVEGHAELSLLNMPLLLEVVDEVGGLSVSSTNAQSKHA